MSDRGTGRQESAASTFRTSGVPGKVHRATSAQFQKSVRTAKAGRIRINTPVKPPASEPAAEKPYAPPAFLGMFELPPDSSERAKAVVRGRDDV